MPTYVYRFVDTGETIEVQQAFTDDALTEATHPQSGRVMAVKKVFTPVGVTFKGSGFYKTDSRGSSSRTATKPSKDSGDGGSSSTDSSTSSTSSTSSSSTSSSSKESTTAAASSD
jgi:predicted nucleic acid-binding Zn ribbon protein